MTEAGTDSVLAGVAVVWVEVPSVADLYCLIASPTDLASSGSFFGPKRIRTTTSMRAISQGPMKGVCFTSDRELRFRH